ncbi:hypothetical protein GVAV_001529 [Gurleya vavrai]
MRKPKIILKVKNLNNIPEYYQINITTPYLGPDINTILIKMNKLNKSKYLILVSFLKKNFLEKNLVVSSNILKYKIDDDAPEIFSILLNIYNYHRFDSLYKCLLDKEFRNLSVGFYCKIFFIRQNFILKKYNDELMILYKVIFETKLNPLKFLNQNILKIYNFYSSKKIIMALENHYFFEIFGLFILQKSTIIEFLNLLDDFYYDAAKIIRGHFSTNYEHDFRIKVIRASNFSRTKSISSIFNTFRVFMT